MNDKHPFSKVANISGRWSASKVVTGRRISHLLALLGRGLARRYRTQLRKVVIAVQVDVTSESEG
jgi:hypothetical protein